MEKIADVRWALYKSWHVIRQQCLSVTASKEHYRAMIYHLLRNNSSVPLTQMGVGVQISFGAIREVLAERRFDTKESGVTINAQPDIVVFSSDIKCDWRERNAENIVKNMRAVIEIMAQEKIHTPIRLKDVHAKIDNLFNLRSKVCDLGYDFMPLLLIIDPSKERGEVMQYSEVQASAKKAREAGVEFLYASEVVEMNSIDAGGRTC